MPRMYTSARRDARSVDIQYRLKVSSIQQRSFNASLVISMDTLQAYVIKKNMFHSSQGNQRLICCKWEQYMLDKSICGHSKDCSSSDELFCLQVKIQ